MKLRNKKTGKIVDSIQPLIGGDGYSSLAELNEEWEDCKGYWYIGDGGGVCLSRTQYILEDEDKAHKEIGNYFETKEEAEKACDKLKAWNRLKDKGFEFDFPVGVGSLDKYEGKFVIDITATMPSKWFANDKIQDDLDYLFGGEE